MGKERNIRWGILSTAKIGVEKVIPAMQQADNCEIVAISSRSVERAQEAADKLGIGQAVGSYEELLNLPDIDAVYNPLPNHLHVPWSIKALRAGKHVLCEKPIGLSYKEAETLLAESERHPELKIMEAFMYRHHPRWIKVKELIQKETIGELQTVQSFFSYYNVDPENIRNIADIGGGSLMDIGCYCISVPRFLFDEEPQSVLGSLEEDPNLKIDRLSSGILNFPSGSATFTSGTQLAPHQKVKIFGSKGMIELSMPFNAPTDEPTYIHMQIEGKDHTTEIAPCNQFTAQGERFSQAIIEDRTVPTPFKDALKNMKVIDAIIESSKSNAKITLTNL